MKKERQLEISYGRLMRYIVSAYLSRGVREQTSRYLQPHGSNQHMHYVPREFSGSSESARCALSPKPDAFSAAAVPPGRSITRIRCEARENRHGA